MRFFTRGASHGQGASQCVGGKPRWFARWFGTGGKPGSDGHCFAMESMERRELFSVVALQPIRAVLRPILNGPLFPVSLNVRYGDELVITEHGARDNVTISQNGSNLNITADGVQFIEPVLPGGTYIYARGGHDTVLITLGVSARVIVDTINNTGDMVTSWGTNTIAWSDFGDNVQGTVSNHVVSYFSGGVSKAIGAHLPEPSDMGPAQPISASLFGSGPVISDVNQGQVGDCYFLATVAGIASNQPNRILNSVCDLGDGTFVVQFFHNGWVNYVRVDNQFNTAFARPGSRGTLWGLVMEKAYAYFRTGTNTYASIAAGTPNEALWAFLMKSTTAQPGFFNDNWLLSLLEQDLSLGHPVIFSTSHTATGLIPDHAYTLIGAAKINGVNYYWLRNPWGFGQAPLEDPLSGVAMVTYAQLIANSSAAVGSLN